jgi:hypothetical protein
MPKAAKSSSPKAKGTSSPKGKNNVISLKATKSANESIFDAQLGWKDRKEKIVYGGDCASEPPYSSAELQRTLEVAQTNYAPIGAHARGVKIHNGPLSLRDAKKPPNRVGWVHGDKQYDPYITFSAERPFEKKSGAPPKLWFPKELREPKKKGVEGSGGKLAYLEQDIKDSHKGLAARPRWDSEHHIMVSQANPEVQKFVREYFDRPLRKESEGVPKVRELYSMNDRQTGWWDEASPLGLPKHTYLDSCLEFNVGGPLEGQKVSYWRKVAERGSASMPTLGEKEKLSEPGRYIIKVPADTNKLGFTPVAYPPQAVRIMSVEPESFAERKNINIGDELLAIDDVPVKQMAKQEFIDNLKNSKQLTFYRRSHLSMTQRLADMPAAQATQFWREWVDLSSKRLPPPPEQPKPKKKGAKNAAPSDWDSASKRGGWPVPGATKGDAQTSAAVNPAATSSSGATLKKEKEEREPWNDRWAITASKDNPYCCQGHRQFFTSAQFLSGAEVGHPGALLGMPGQKWRATAKNVTMSPSGASGRGSIGRRCLLV